MSVGILIRLAAKRASLHGVRAADLQELLQVSVGIVIRLAAKRTSLRHRDEAELQIEIHVS